MRMDFMAAIEFMNSLDDLTPLCGTKSSKETMSAITQYITQFHLNALPEGSEEKIRESFLIPTPGESRPEDDGEPLFSPGDFSRCIMNAGPASIKARLPKGMTLFDYLDAIAEVLSVRGRPTLEAVCAVLYFSAKKLSMPGHERAAKALGCEPAITSLLSAALEKLDENQPVNLDEVLNSLTEH